MIFIIAYGNPLRRDDGAGMLLAEQLEQLWTANGTEVELLTVHQLTPELADEMTRDEFRAIIFVDSRALVFDDEPAVIQLQSVNSDDASPHLGHYMSPATLLLMAQLMYGVRLPAWLITVPGVDFRHGEGVSQTVQKALNHIPAEVVHLNERINE